MYIKRDGSIHGPLWPRNIKDIVLDKLDKKYKVRNIHDSNNFTNLQQQSKTSS